MPFLFKRFPLKIGILGGGQLARMLALAAYELGAEPVLFVKNKNECALQVTNAYVIDDGGDDSLKYFVKKVDLLTIESEFTDLTRLRRCLRGKSIFPSLTSLGYVQNKRNQKDYLKKSGIPTLRFVPVNDQADVERAVKEFPQGIVLKQAQMGYDGNGTFIFGRKRFAHLRAFLKQRDSFEGYAEELADFKMEIAVIIARSVTGETKAFPVVETVQRARKCDRVLAPAKIPLAIQKKALAIAQRVIVEFGGVGVFGIEMFWLKDNRVVVNEIAPRVHNSGHFTMNACGVSQFEQHLRAGLGMSLGPTKMNVLGAAMVNIIGERKVDLPNLRQPQRRSRVEKAVGNENVWIHWYGKQGPALDRKLGHVNTTSDKSADDALKTALRVRREILI